MIIFFLAIVAFSLILIKSADLVLVSIKRLAKNVSRKSFIISSVVLALGTSLPELFVSITSSLEGKSNLSLGVVVGSNIANIALIGGLSAFAVGRIHVFGDYIRRDILIAFLAGILPLFLVLDRSLSRVDGLILLTIYFAYSMGFFRGEYVAIGKEQGYDEFTTKIIRKINHRDGSKTKDFGRLFVGIALMLFSADMIVKLSANLAITLKIPLFVIGLVILAVGTSLPELVFSLKSLHDHEQQMFLGNLLGSTIANSTLIIGMTGLIKPFQLIAVSEYLMATVTFVIVFLLFWLFIKSKRRLDRWEAAILILVYIVFMSIEFLK